MDKQELTTESTENTEGEDVSSLNRVTGESIDAARKVHSAPGPGLLESTYEACLVHELRKRKARNRIALPVFYDGTKIEVGYRIDLLVEDEVVVEWKSVEALGKLHEAQLISYLKRTKKKIGLLINFNVVRLKEGTRRFMNQCLLCALCG